MNDDPAIDLSSYRMKLFMDQKIRETVENAFENKAAEIIENGPVVFSGGDVKYYIDAIATALRKVAEAEREWWLKALSSQINCTTRVCRDANKLGSKVDGLEAAINADEIALILSENEGASHGYLAVQICEKIEADAHEKHLSSEYMRTRQAKENTDA